MVTVSHVQIQQQLLTLQHSMACVRMPLHAGIEQANNFEIRVPSLAKAVWMRNMKKHGCNCWAPCVRICHDNANG